VEYQIAVSNYVGYMEYLIENTAHSDLLLVGDFNFPCVLSNCGFRALNNFIQCS
jgi:hypothetical protein